MGVIFQEAEIVRNYEVTNNFYILEIYAPPIACQSQAGQFIMIASSTMTYDPLLPRAFSMARRTPETLTFIYKLIGRGTGLLAAKRPGDRLRIWGPLGKGFSFEGGKPVLLGGGTGIAPLIDLGDELTRAGVDFALVCGGRTAEDLKFMDEFSDVAAYIPFTEDGSLGRMGYATAYIEEGNVSGDSVIYSCGPMGMLKRVGELARERSLRCYFSIETPMACGLGTCLGCAVPRRGGGGYFKACTDGPVFEASEVMI